MGRPSPQDVLEAYPFYLEDEAPVILGVMSDVQVT